MEPEGRTFLGETFGGGFDNKKKIPTSAPKKP